jgi:hypothetical protein
MTTSGARDTNETALADDGGELDPRQAATLLEQTTRDAQRQFDITPPLISLIRAAVILVGYGALWLSVHGQHPYKGPSLAALAVVYTAVIVVIAMTVKVVQRATAGVSGRSQRQMQAEGAAVAVAYIATAVFQGALLHDGASHAIVYGVFPAAAALLVVGATLAGSAATRADWPSFGLASWVIAVGVGASFAGPAGAWAVAGIGLCVAVLGHAAATAWLHWRMPVHA